MNGLDKIISRIEAEGKEAEDAALRHAREVSDAERAEKISAANEKAAAIRAGAVRDAARIKERAEATAETVRRSASLRVRGDAVDASFEAAVASLRTLDRARAVPFFSAQILPLGHGGVLRMNARDRACYGETLCAKLQEQGLSVTLAEADEAVDGGVILDSGDVVYNISAAALVAQARGELEGDVFRMLF